MYLQFETNTKCNAHCSICPHPGMPKRDPMPGSMIGKIIREIAPHVDGCLPFLYQEPMMEERLIEILKLIKETNKDCTTAIYSNMGLLTREKAEEIIKAGVLDQLFISFYGPNADLYHKYQAGLNRDSVIQNIKDLMEARGENERPLVTMWYLNIPDLMDEIDAMKPVAELVDRFGVVSYDDFCGLKPALVTYPQTERKPCPRLWDGVNILCDGTVVPCCLDYSGSIPLGNAFVDNGLEIWKNGYRMSKLREMHLNKQWGKLPELCKRCSVWKRG